MRDLAAHSADMLRNALEAGAKNIDISLKIGPKWMLLAFSDDGCGMDASEARRAVSPFYSTKGKGFGFGLPLLKTAAETAEGFFRICSKKGQGTQIKAVFSKTHPDSKPAGNIAGMVAAFMQSCPEANICFLLSVGSKRLRFESAQLWADRCGRENLLPAAAKEFLNQYNTMIETERAIRYENIS